MTSQPLISITKNTFQLNGRTLWRNLDLTVQPGEFVAVLGPNGAGKTTLLRGLLGLHKFTKGTVTVQGKEPRKGSGGIGYIPQQKTFDRDAPIRGRDLVALGLDGHKLGFAFGGKQNNRVNEVISEVGASKYADQPIGQLSGGEQQRLRIAQSLLSNPALLFCDEPLSSLDLKSQQSVSQLIDDYRKKTNAAVLFVTHDINPVLGMVDKVLYLANGKWVVGTPDEVLTTESLSKLYGTPVDVVKVRGHIVVVSTGESIGTSGHHHVHAIHEGSHND
jgi:zinc/manganese transport system ATP-binding protein